MENRRTIWLVPALALILLNYIIPYVVLDDVDAWYGSMLFWALTTAVVIGINCIVSSAWKD